MSLAPPIALAWMPARSWWLLTAVVVSLGLMTSWYVALGAAVVLLLQVGRPLDFMIAFLMVMGGAAFVYYEGGQLMRDLVLLGCGIAFMLASYLVSVGVRSLTIAWNQLSIVLLLFLGVSIMNAVRGYWGGYPVKHVTAELLAILALATTLLVANVFQARRDLRLAFIAMLATALGSAAMGFHVFAIIRTHTSGVFFIPVPGIVGLFMFNLALRSRRATTAALWIVASLPLFLQQFLSYRRGLWVGCLAGFVVSLLAFSGPSPQAPLRRRRLVGVLSLLAFLGVLGAVVMATVYGQTDILSEAGARLTSIGQTKIDPKRPIDSSSMSNIERLVEYGTVGQRIRESPLLGHGLGYTFLGIKPRPLQIKPQWWVHQNYLLIWLKQGALGLAIFLWLLAVAIGFGIRHARKSTDAWEGSWLATTAAATAYMAMFSMSDFPFAQVNVTFMLALFWGGALAIQRVPMVHVHWSSPEARGTAESFGGAPAGRE